MAKKGSKQPPGLGDQAPLATSSAPVEPTTSGSPKTFLTHPPSPLVICRNKHWRYISSWHGSWLQVPTEVLEAVANVNYSTLRPRPIDHATFFDLVKIRRLVDEATNLAVRAASGISSPTLTNVNGSLPEDAAMASLAMGGLGHGVKLSRERKFRMREQASQKLSRAYRLNEIASSVATMQEASPLESVGTLVLQRNPEDIDARYVHFLHEKVPSRHISDPASLLPLAKIISERSTEPEFLRTRAMAKSLMEDHEGAVHDLTLALAVHRRHQPQPDPMEHDVQRQGSNWSIRRPQDTVLAEKEQPSSFESQLLFLRATAYLALSCQHLKNATPPSCSCDRNGHTEPSRTNETLASKTNGNDSFGKDEESQRQTELRKLVKTYAKRSLRDYMAFLSDIEYAPKLPVRVVVDFNERVNAAAHGIRNPRSNDAGPPIEPYTIYSISDLFAAVPPLDIPSFPPLNTEDAPQISCPSTCEATTFHPLLSDALHSVLLCHCLIQTSPKELLRHAYMVARLVRLSDGYPIFPGGRSPARSDWIDLVRRMNNWLQLSASWESLIAPAPLPFLEKCEHQHGPSFERAASAAAAMINGETPNTSSEPERTKQVREQAILNALYEGGAFENLNIGVDSKKSGQKDKLTLTISSDIKRTGRAGTYMTDFNIRPALDNGSCNNSSASDGIPEYPTAFYGERASVIARWLREAPVVKGTTKKKKRGKKPGKTEGLGGAMGDIRMEQTVGPANSG